jgi:hypothetical protein
MASLILRARTDPPSTLLAPRHYWAFEEANDARWDRIGDAHAMPYAGPIPVVETSLGNGVRPNDGTSISAKHVLLGGSRGFTIGVWAQTSGNGGDIVVDTQYAGVVAAGGFRIVINFGNSTHFRFWINGVAQTITLAQGADAGAELKLYWLSYDADALTAYAAINDGAWQSASLSGQIGVATEIFFGSSGYNRLNAETTVAEAVVWDRFMPSQAERADMYANWRGPEYFSNTDTTPPASPFTDVTLVDMDWLSDADLDNPGTYYLRPYPLHVWDAELAAEKGDYVWMRSTDHGDGGLYIGYSDSPATPPAAWAEFINYSGIETPDLTYHPDDPDGLPFYVTSHIVDSTLTQHITGTVASQAIYQTTVLHRSADLETWELHGTILPNTPYVPIDAFDMNNHTGYMVKTPWGDGTWRGYSTLNDFYGSSYTLINALLQNGSRGSITHSNGRPAKRGWWSSTDGLDWTLVRLFDQTLSAPSNALQNGIYGFFSMDGQRYAISEASNGGFNLARVFKLKSNGDLVYPGWPIETRLTSDFGGVWQQGIWMFCEGSIAHIYIKHGYKEPNGVIAYYTATLTGTLDA